MAVSNSSAISDTLQIGDLFVGAGGDPDNLVAYLHVTFDPATNATSVELVSQPDAAAALDQKNRAGGSESHHTGRARWRHHQSPPERRHLARRCLRKHLPIRSSHLVIGLGVTSLTIDTIHTTKNYANFALRFDHSRESCESCPFCFFLIRGQSRNQVQQKARRSSTGLSAKRIAKFEVFPLRQAVLASRLS